MEIWAQVQTLKRQATERGVTLQVEKLDVTSDGDRRKTLSWNIESLVNNAGVGEGGAIVDIPAANVGNQFEVNLVGPFMLTQGIAKQMVRRGESRIVWVSATEGLNVNPFTGVYSASKHALEAIAEKHRGRVATRCGTDRPPLAPAPRMCARGRRPPTAHLLLRPGLCCRAHSRRAGVCRSRSGAGWTPGRTCGGAPLLVRASAVSDGGQGLFAHQADGADQGATGVAGCVPDTDDLDVVRQQIIGAGIQCGRKGVAGRRLREPPV